MSSTPAPSVAALFDDLADGYDLDVGFFDLAATPLVAAAAPRPGDVGLDLGAGRGAVTGPLAAAIGPSGRVVAIDVAPRMLQGWSSATDPAAAPVLALVAGAEGLPVPDASIDLVTSGFLVHVLPDPGVALAEVSRVLRPGGALVASTPAPHPRMAEWGAAYGQLFVEYAPRATAPPPPGFAPVARPWTEVAAQVGLTAPEITVTTVEVPLDGPEHLWAWLMSHGNRWLLDRLDGPDRVAFRDSVLRTIVEHHPTGGHDLLAAVALHRCCRPT